MKPNKPVDHTTLAILVSGEVRIERVEYSRYGKFEDLPGVVKCDEIRAEFEAYKAWERRHAS